MGSKVTLLLFHCTISLGGGSIGRKEGRREGRRERWREEGWGEK